MSGQSCCVLVPCGYAGGERLWLCVLATKWGYKVEVPGGKVEPGEEPVEAAARECHEETGFRPKNLRPIHRGPCNGFDATAFLADPMTEMPGKCASGVAFWGTRGDITHPERGVYAPFMGEVFAALDAQEDVPDRRIISPDQAAAGKAVAAMLRSRAAELAWDTARWSYGLAMHAAANVRATAKADLDAALDEIISLALSKNRGGL